MANKGMEIPQTRGTFQLKGIVLGVGKDSFYKQIKTKTEKDMRTINFGIQTSKENVFYVTFNGMPQEYVYFSGKPKGAAKDSKNVTEKVEWKNRNSYKREGFRLIGIMCGLEKTQDEKGRDVNEKKTLHPFDAAEYVSEHLKDGQSVFVKGTIEYGHYNKGEETFQTVKLIPNQISLCGEVVFDAIDEHGKPTYEVIANFNQDLVFQGIEKDSEDGEKFNLTANIVNYNTVETSDFVITDKKLATNFKKNLKPYTFIKTWGNLTTVRNVVEVEPDEDGWGTSNPMQRLTSPYRVERVITGADPNSIDRDNYTEKKIVVALEAMKEAEEKNKAFESAEDNWGEKSNKDDDEELPW